MVVGGVLDVDWGDREWTIDLSYTATEHDSANSQVQDTLSTEMMLAINGLGGPNCDHVNGTPGEGNLAYAASGGDLEQVVTTTSTHLAIQCSIEQVGCRMI